MGKDKSTLVINGKHLWLRQISLFRELKLDAIYISARVMPAWAPADVTVVLDEPPSRGPLSGIALGLSQMMTSHLLVLGVDLPQVTAKYLQKLIGLATNGKGVVPCNQGRFEPLTAIYPKEAAPLALESLASGDVSLQSFIGRLKEQSLVFDYPVPPEEWFLHRNLNTPQDLLHLPKQ